MYDWGYALYPQSYKRLKILQFSAYIFSADISPEMSKLGRVTKVKVLFLALVFVFNFELYKISAAILEKGLLTSLPMCGFIAQLVEHRTGIAEVTDSNPVAALIFSGFFFPVA